MMGPHHSIICSFTGTGHGAAAWMMVSSDDTSYASRTSSGSLSIRLNMVGTTWEWVTRCCSTRRRNCTASKRSMMIDVAPSRSDSDTLACGAEW